MPKDRKIVYRKDDLWISQSHSLKSSARQNDWELTQGKPAESNRFLELADIALGLKNREIHKKKRPA
jgi:hypothetical protein